MIHVHAVLSRLGLGNRLFPWARAEILRHRFGCGMLEPVWFKPALGPWLRGEADRRHYWRLFTSAGYVSGLHRLRLWGVGRRWPEPVDWFRAEPVVLPANGVIFVRGLKPPGFAGDYFEPLRGHAALVGRRLREIARPGILRGLPDPQVPFIGVHIRRGDLTATLNDPRHPAHVPAGWYAEAIRGLVAGAGLQGWPVKVMTDGETEVRGLLRGVPGVEFVDLGNALANIFCLARAAVFVGTGYSTFSRWISFLGAMPTVFHPGYVPPGFGHAAFHGGYDPAAPLPGLLRDQLGAWSGLPATALLSSHSP